MFSEKTTKELMTVEDTLVSFMNRIDEAYVASQTINDLVTDSDYQRLVIKHGKAAGTPLGNRYLLPGYWFTVFVAPYESFQRVLQSIEIENRNHNAADVKFLNEISEETKGEVHDALRNFKHMIGFKALQPVVKRFQTQIEDLLSSVDLSESNSATVGQQFKKIITSITTASYEFSDKEGDLTCTFFENDTLCGQRFEVKVTVAEFTQFSIDFTKQLIELVRPIVECDKNIANVVSRMLVAEQLLR